MRAVIAVAGGLLIAGGFWFYLQGSTASSSQPLALAPPVPQVAEPQPATSADMQRTRNQYLGDRERVRKAKPKTEDEVTNRIGRPPDNIIETPQMSIVQWYYDDKPAGRDVLQVTVEGGVPLMNL